MYIQFWKNLLLKALYMISMMKSLTILSAYANPAKLNYLTL